mgnify:CR=1 FL=1
MQKPDELTKMQWALMAQMLRPSLQKVASFWYECTKEERKNLPYDKNDLEEIAKFAGFDLSWDKFPKETQ